MKRKLLIIMGLLLMIGAMSMILVYVPTDRETGIVQRIFYIHVPLGWAAFLGFLITFICSILYINKRQPKWDRLASSSAEIGVIFLALMIICGSIWAKPTWGAWWIWDARLTTSVILLFIYVAYFVVRSYIREEDRRARFSAVVGIIGFLDIPLIFLSVNLWRTHHTGLIIFEGGMVPAMYLTLLVSLIAFSTLFSILLIERYKMKNDIQALKHLKETVNRR